MGFIEAGYSSYAEYLLSPWFAMVKTKAWNNAKKGCGVCGKKFDLSAHHLSYAEIGRKGEWKTIRFLCSRHHEMCHHLFWLIKIPLTPGFLGSRYYFVKIRFFILNSIFKLFKWLWFTYTVYGDSPRRRRWTRNIY